MFDFTSIYQMKLSKSLLTRLLLVFIFTVICMASVNRHFLNEIGNQSLFLYLNGSTYGNVKIYWDTGKGYNENETRTQNIGDYQKQLLRFKVPNNLQGLRIDTDIQPSQFRVLSCRIGYFRWPFSYGIPAVNWRSGNQTQCVPSSNHPLTLDVQIAPDATDPYCLIELPSDEIQAPWENLGLIRFSIQALTVLTGLVSVLFTLLFSKSR